MILTSIPCDQFITIFSSNRVPTIVLKGNEVLVKNDIGTLVAVGADVTHLSIGDKVFGFAGREEKAYQTFVTAPETKFGKIPSNITQQEAATIPTNLVATFHTIVSDLGLTLPWPKPDDYSPKDDRPVLVWGASSSVGQYSIQVLKYYGYSNIYAVASQRRYILLHSHGATKTFDYSDSAVVSQLRSLGGLPLIIDCIGSRDNSLAFVARVAESGSKVAIMLLVIVKDASETSEPVWADGVEARGVRTHSYQENTFHVEHLQRTVMPGLIAKGVITPNRVRLIEGKDTLERAEKALSLLRNRAVSGLKVVFKCDDEEVQAEVLREEGIH
ncbi:hypothetical protein BDZ85DRAFT_272983 [Elsinoe ampelina]|uniref:Enoyl reductase (ER) domain-containing protein n=1 Tax=Elsinoe ampelina TaxID=302913 RepID=A0A6A6GH65_9PEZI|nr:hypothetical protein BDZ85DRAFT_272983 [Elsinoe ampelina]